MSGGQSFDHCSGQAAPLAPVALLQFRHRPGELPHRQHLDLVGQRRALLTKIEP